MDARRIRTLAAPAFAVGLLVTLWVAPAAAADCALGAPSTVEVGTPLAIDGTGFPASSSVDIKLTIEGGTTDQFAVQSDAAGGFQITLTPEAADAGKTTIVATAGSVCSARVVSTVLSPNDTPSSSAELAGGTAGANGTPSAPRTDAAAAPGEGPGGAPSNAWLLAVLALIIGVTGLIATRPTPINTPKPGAS